MPSSFPLANVEKRCWGTGSCVLPPRPVSQEGEGVPAMPIIHTTSTLCMMCRWIAYQLLHALAQCHEAGVCHGDLKSENVLLTSWT